VVRIAVPVFRSSGRSWRVLRDRKCPRLPCARIGALHGLRDGLGNSVAADPRLCPVGRRSGGGDQSEMSRLLPDFPLRSSVIATALGATRTYGSSWRGSARHSRTSISGVRRTASLRAISRSSLGRRRHPSGPAFSYFLMGSLPAASGRKMRFAGTTVLRVENGRIA